MVHTLQVLTIVVVGVMVGVEFSVAFVMNRIFDALPENSGQLARAHGGRMLGALMPFWYIGSLALSAVWAVAAWSRPGTGLVVTGAALLVVSVIMSILLLVPINNRGKTWTPENRPADWKEQMNRWDRYHYVRVAVIVAAFAFLAAGLAVA
ncbi:anthrone oxygenase family protein [Streptomyces filamentosus]|uniref:anthrone oxygenase family protein n=1 Tax=Streptomyces filamentosus TaxID=67294 RepID=UPI00382125EA